MTLKNKAKADPPSPLAAAQGYGGTGAKVVVPSIHTVCEHFKEAFNAVIEC